MGNRVGDSCPTCGHTAYNRFDIPQSVVKEMNDLCDKLNAEDEHEKNKTLKTLLRS
jgi:hypothetical protein